MVLGGGVFQNRILLTGMEERLQGEGFQVYSKALVPSNDGGIALGQAVAAHYMVKRNEESRIQESESRIKNTRGESPFLITWQEKSSR